MQTRIIRVGLCVGLLLVGFSCAPAAKAPPPTQTLASPQDLPGLPNFAKVSDGLYRGGQPTRQGFEQLKKMGIKTIVDLRGKSHRDELEGLGMRYVHIPSSVLHIEDADVLAFLRLVNDPANQPVFVHCLRGADRTSCYVAVYRMAEQGWGRSDAKAELSNFHYDPFWRSVVSYIDQIDVKKLHIAAVQPPAMQPAATQPAIAAR